MGTIVARGALVERLEVDGVLEGAVLDQGTLGDVLVVAGEAHDEAEAGLGVGVELAGAELDDVAEALLGAVLALYTVVFGSAGTKAGVSTL